MAEAQRGDAEAYRALLNDIGPEVMGYLRSRVPNPQEAEDLYQETFLLLHQARRTYKPLRPVEPWLFAIARHVLARHLRQRRTQAGREVLVDAPEGVTEESGPARVRLAQALGHLPPTHREAIELLKLEGLSTKAAAARAETTPGALRVRAHRAYKALRQLLRS
jgi:RNA polymerase sigma-70 factor (ECF subfamily)